MCTISCILYTFVQYFTILYACYNVHIFLFSFLLDRIFRDKKAFFLYINVHLYTNVIVKQCTLICTVVQYGALWRDLKSIKKGLIREY